MPNRTSETCPTCDRSNNLPEFADRNTLAEIITRRLFPVTARTIRSWPLSVWHPNGKAIHRVFEALAYAEAKMNAAPETRQGR